MQSEGTLLVRRSDVEALLSLHECIDAVEEVFRAQGNGKVPAAGILAVNAPGGGLHVKAALLPRDKDYIVAKLNTNFPGNRAQSQLPTIQGVIVVYDAENGFPLAILDSIDVTIKRTAAASTVAAKYLARPDSSTATVCGCGQQGRAQLRAIHLVLPLQKIYAFDLDNCAGKNLAAELGDELNLEIEPVRNPQRAIQKSDLCITCTTSREFFVRKEDVAPGTFIAAVGADHENKQEVDPALIASAKVVADNLEQSCTIGDTHHAIAQGLMRKQDVYADLSEVVAGHKPGRTNNNEITIFDSTGVAIEDAVAAVAVYKKARATSIGSYFSFAG
jgi:alanine dehydrogenase